jgi:hypothetical protein
VEAGEEEIVASGVSADEGVVAGKVDADSGAREGDEGHGVGQHSGVAVKMDVGWVLVSGTLRGGNGNSFVATLTDGEGRGLGIAHDGGIGRKSLVETGEARLRREGANAEKLGNTLRDTAAPEAIEVEVGAEMADFGREAVVA